MSTRKSIKPAPKTSKPQPKARPAPKSSSKSNPKAAVKATAPSRATKPASTISSSAAPSPASKQSQLLDLLRTRGATIPQMSKLTGWQAHTIRATMSAVFRKRLGLTIEASKVEGSTGRMYRVTGQAAA